MPRLTLDLDRRAYARLEELAGFEGESLEETVRLALRYHWNHYQAFKAECEEGERAARETPRPARAFEEDEIPF